jgi:hypothetical protein
VNFRTSLDSNNLHSALFIKLSSMYIVLASSKIKHSILSNGRNNFLKLKLLVTGKVHIIGFI